jgi:D-proline reductase (dithiol) PrdB
LAQRRVAIISSAALIRRGDAPLPFGSPEVRFLPHDVPPSDLLVSHVSINFDRSGCQRDINTVYPIKRLRGLVDEGIIGVEHDPKSSKYFQMAL